MARTALLALCALGMALLAGGCSDSSRMTADDATTYTREALSIIGLRQIQIVDGPRPGTYGTSEIPVWEVEAVVDGGRVEMAIERDGSYVRFIRDVADNGGPLLTEDQVDELADYSDNPATDRRRDRTVVPAIVAAVLLSLTAAGLVNVSLSARRTAAGNAAAG